MDYCTNRRKVNGFHTSKISRGSKAVASSGKMATSCYNFPSRKIVKQSVLPPILAPDNDSNNEKISVKKNGKIAAYAVKTSCGIYR